MQGDKYVVIKRQRGDGQFEEVHRTEVCPSKCGLLTLCLPQFALVLPLPYSAYFCLSVSLSTFVLPILPSAFLCLSPYCLCLL